MEYLPDHVLVSIFSKSQNILNLSEVCVRYHDLIASTTSLMKRVKINLTSPAKELLNKSTRKYQNVLIFPPINYHNDFFECLEPFSGSLQMLEIKFTVNTSFEGFREPLYSIYMERKSQQPPQVLQPLTTLQLPKLKKLVLAATDYKIFKYLKIQLNELVLEQCQTGSCEELKTFLKTQNQLKFLNLDRVSSRFLFNQDVSKIFDFNLKQLQLEYGRSMPWETRIELVNMHLFWKSQSSLEKIVMDMHAIRIDENFADILKEMKGFKDLKLILGSDKFEERCTVDVPQELVAELEVKHDFSKGSRTRQKISTELLNLVQKFPKTKKISFNAVQIDESAYELLGHLPSLEEISFENCQVVDYQGLKVKKLAFKNMKLQTTKVFLKVNQQVTELIVDEINMKDFLRARVQEIKKDA